MMVDTTAVASEAELEDAGSDLVEETKSVDSDESFWKELSVLGDIAKAERECQSLQDQFDLLTEQRSDVKELLAESTIRLRMATASLADQYEGDEPTEAKEFNWEEFPTETLLEGISGLGKKKMEAMLDLAPTAGDLEELRVSAAVQKVLFDSVLPKGCGSSMADEIENRLIELIAKSSMEPPGDGEYGDVEDDGDDEEGMFADL